MLIPNVSRPASRALFAIALFLALAVDAHADRLQVCAFSFNTPDEVRVFQSRLPEEDFDVVDLSPRLPLPAHSTGADGAGESWLSNLCRPDLQCDIVVFAAEFGGRFFGAYGISLGLQEMEELSCQSRCAGLFRRPREVFLLACNTLATKDQDSRTPAEYLEVLRDHGFDRAAAERVVALRYGPLGPSFREAIRRIFVDVPRVYGFSSVAPAGGRTAPLLEKYFRSKGDYRTYLDRVARRAAPNRELLTAFRGRDLVQIEGSSSADPTAADRIDICGLYDESESVADRLQIVARLLDREDFFAFLPTIQVFVARHPVKQFNRNERRLFAQIQDHDAARDRTLRLVRELNVSALKMELAHLAVNLEWMPHDEFRRLAVDGARQLLAQPITSEVTDIMCEIAKHERVGDAFRAKDLPPQFFRDALTIRLVDCLAPTDERVSTMLLAGLDSDDLSTRLWAAYALSHRLPLDDGILLKLTTHLADPSPDVRARLQYVFAAQSPVSDEVRREVRGYDRKLADDLRLREQTRR